MNVDPMASMRCWAAEIQVGGRTYEVPALPAVDWWPVVVGNDPSMILDFLVSTPDDDLDERLLTGQVDGEELNTALVDALEEMTGRSRRAGFVIASLAEMWWATVGGALAQRGFRWDVMPIAAALDAIHALVVEGTTKEDRDRYLALLDDAPAKGELSPEAVSQFELLAGPKPKTGVRSTGAQSGNARPKTRIRRQPPRPDGPSDGPTPPPGRPAGSGPAASS